jgi:hypothetical protein
MKGLREITRQRRDNGRPRLLDDHLNRSSFADTLFSFLLPLMGEDGLLFSYGM